MSVSALPLVLNETNDNQSQWLATLLKRDILDEPGRELQATVSIAENSATATQKATLAESRILLSHSLKVVSAACRRQKPDGRAAQTLRQKLSYASEKACQTILHYQGVFDVLNEQAPEYTTALWGAIKLLCLVVVNRSEIETKVNDSLTDLIWAFRELELHVGTSPTESIVILTTDAYRSFLEFLTKVVKFVQLSKPAKWGKALIQPWKLQFQPEIDKIHKALQTARNVAQASANLQLRQINASVIDGISRLEQRVDFFQSVWNESMSKRNQGAAADFQALKRQLSYIVQQQAYVLDAMNGTVNLAVRSAPFRVDGTSPVPAIQSLRPREYISDFIETGNNVSDPLLDRLNLMFPTASRLVVSREVLYGRLYPIQEGDSAGLYNANRNEQVLFWLGSTDSQLLWIDGFRERDTSWTTIFSTEILKACETWTREVSFVCLHLFGDDIVDNTDDTSTLVAMITQSLVIQFLHQSREKLGPVPCLDHDLTMQNLEAASSSVRQLLNVLSVLIAIVRPVNTLVVFDNIDRITTTLDLSKEKVRTDFLTLLQFLKRLSRDDTMCTKVLITSQISSTEDLLMKEVTEPSTEPERHRVVTIPTREVLYRDVVVRHSHKRRQSTIEEAEKVEAVVHLLRTGRVGDLFKNEINSPELTREPEEMKNSDLTAEDQAIDALIFRHSNREVLQNADVLETDEGKSKRSRWSDKAEDDSLRWILDKSQRTRSAKERDEWLRSLFDDEDTTTTTSEKQIQAPPTQRKDSTASEGSLDSLDEFMRNASSRRQSRKENDVDPQSESRTSNPFAALGIDI